MLRVNIALLQPGMVTAHNVYNADGLLLVSGGKALDAPQIKRQQSIGLRSVYVENALLENVAVPALVSDRPQRYGFLPHEAYELRI